MLGGEKSGREYVGTGIRNSYNVYTAIEGNNRSHTGHINLKYRQNRKMMLERERELKGGERGTNEGD